MENMYIFPMTKYNLSNIKGRRNFITTHLKVEYQPHDKNFGNESIGNVNMKQKKKSEKKQ